MSITFHCEYCNKKIEAPDDAGGKWGKCPSCHNKVYIPDLKADDGDELKLAPVDEQDEERQKKLMAETFQLSQDILKEREDEKKSSAGPVKVSEAQLKENIILYLKQMAAGQLEKADRIANSIIPSGSKAIEIIDKIALADMPESELANIPQQILSSLLKTLRNKIR